MCRKQSIPARGGLDEEPGSHARAVISSLLRRAAVFLPSGCRSWWRLYGERSSDHLVPCPIPPGALGPQKASDYVLSGGVSVEFQRLALLRRSSEFSSALFVSRPCVSHEVNSTRRLGLVSNYYHQEFFSAGLLFGLLLTCWTGLETELSIQ